MEVVQEDKDATIGARSCMRDQPAGSIAKSRTYLSIWAVSISNVIDALRIDLE